jgi:hypothetical protein
MATRRQGSTICDDLLRPGRLWSRQDVFSRRSPVPKAPGVYAWYFRNMPPHVPTTGCTITGDFHLLYVGISRSAPPKSGKAASKQNLSRRIRSHMRGNASGSTLRLSLGCILTDRLGIALRRVGRRGRFTFSAGEQRLSAWMEENARVVWKVCEETHLPQFSSQPSGFTECSVGSLIWKLETSDLAIISSHSSM